MVVVLILTMEREGKGQQDSNLSNGNAYREVTLKPVPQHNRDNQYEKNQCKLVFPLFNDPSY